MRDPLDSNKAMGAKIWWKWITYEDEPWAKLWHAKYAHQWPQQTLIRFGENLPGSSIWKAAQEKHDLIQRHSFWEVRDGNSARFVSEAWNQEKSIDNREDIPILKMHS